LTSLLSERTLIERLPLSSRRSETPVAPDLRELLLDAAGRVLEDQGPGAVTTRRIAREAGCSEGSIYNHFESKEELLACVVGDRIAGFPARVEELAASPGAGDVRAQLREVAELALGFYRRGTPMMAIALRDPAAMRERARTIHDRGHGPWRVVERLASWLRAEQDLGRLAASADPEAAATALLGACLYHALVSTSWGAELAPSTRTAIERAVAGAWQGLDPDRYPVTSISEARP
jgi:AcrR family transcriptional regulator